MTGADLAGEIQRLAPTLLAQCRRHGIMLATAESCTGGLVAAALTEVPGSSDVFERGFVTYSNAAKQAQLGVEPSLLEGHGAVSEAVARAMAEGAVRFSRSQRAVAITGVAGPGGGTAEKPVGLVHFAVASIAEATVHHRALFGDIGRSQVRLASVHTALTMLLEAVS